MLLGDIMRMGRAWVEAWFKDGQLEGKTRVYFENSNLNAELSFCKSKLNEK